MQSIHKFGGKIRPKILRKNNNLFIILIFVVLFYTEWDEKNTTIIFQIYVLCFYNTSYHYEEIHKPLFTGYRVCGHFIIKLHKHILYII